MSLKYLSRSSLIALLLSLAGCQTIQNNNLVGSETDVIDNRSEPPKPKVEDVTEDRPESPEPSLSNAIEKQTESIDPNLSDEAMYDPLAIIRELGEAVDSPNIVEEANKTDPSTPPETDLAAIEGTIWAEVIGRFALEDLKETKYADLHRRRLTHSPGFFADFLVKADIYLAYVWTEVKRRGLPAELALLPYVESAYSPWAVSRMGAVGMWQIMPGTGGGSKTQTWSNM